jgi:colanic acid biosynthesis glycosyl transferase WcaI
VKTMVPGSRTALVLYHYLYPDDVVSSVLFTELCTGLTARGWRITGSSCNRGWKDETMTYPARTVWNGVEFLRIRRPNFRQASGFGRIVNCSWMIASWSLMALNPRFRPDVLIIGTDPVLGVIVALTWKLFRPRTRIAHWCFDLYPEAAIAGGYAQEGSLSVRALKHLMRLAYRRCSLIVDIGTCVRRRLQPYGSFAHSATITPWALTEPSQPVPADPVERKALFGNARLGLLYSGSFGRAHSWQGIPELAAALAPLGGRIAFSVQGNAAEDLRDSMEKAGADVTFAPFAPGQDLQTRLGAADVHIVTLREEWTGTVVPSKFFGALAIGRPVLFIGSPESAIAKWIEEFQVGWVLTPENRAAVVEDLILVSKSPERKARLFEHCHAMYRENFSRTQALDSWDGALRSCLA